MEIHHHFACALALTLFLPATALGDRKAKPPSPDRQAATKAETRSGETRTAKGSGKNKNKRSPKRPVAAADYAQWEQLRLGEDLFSKDGRWLVYTIQRIDEEKELHLHRVEGKKAPREESYEHGERPVFSNDSAWLAVTIGKPADEEKKAAEKESKPPQAAGKSIRLRHLANAETTEFENVGGLRFSENSRFAAIEVLGKPKKDDASSGSNKALLVRNLETGTDTTFGNIARHAWSEEGALLAMVVDSPSISNSLQLFDPSRGVLRTLDTSDQEYAALEWRKESFDLAAMRETAHGEKEEASHVLLAWRGLDQDDADSFSYEHAGKRSFPEEMRIVPGLSWSKDGEALFFDLQQWEKKPANFPAPKKKGDKKKRKNGNEEEEESPSEKNKEREEEASENEREDDDEKEEEKQSEEPKSLRETLEKPSNVEVWHAKDVDIMPRQKKRADAEKNPKRKAMWWLESGKFVQLANELTEEVRILGDGRRAVGADRTPHERTAMFGPRLEDLYLINARNGKRERILEGVKFVLTPSPDGRYVLYIRDGDVWSHDVKSGKQRNLTGELDAEFTDQEDDTLALEKKPFSGGTWLEDSSAVVLYDRFDMWLIAPNGSRALRLTDGADDMIRHRLSRAGLDPEERTIDPSRPLYVALYGDRSKKHGYGRLSPRAKVRKPGKLERLLWDDRLIANLTRAEEADVFALTMERAEEPQNLYLAGPDLAKPRRVTETNAFQKDFLWARSELIDFENKDGVKLQGALTYPADYKRGEKYPMIVYIYEKRSQNLHRYIPPSEKHPYNPTVFSAEGYFVFQPDIVYRPQEPGLSALDCVVPAVEAVIETGMIDRERIGLMGHSWGGYQTAFIVTRCDLFAAGVAGAPLTDMMSMSVSVYWNSGQTNAAIFTQSQGRMDKPFWRDIDNYVANSPIHGIDSLDTPLLVAFGDKDGAVDWDQGIQFYNAARWAGKDDFVMLVYPGENHGLRKDENRVDYHYRVREWFAHHVKGEEARPWITDGKSFLEREKEKEELKKKD